MARTERCDLVELAEVSPCPRVHAVSAARRHSISGEPGKGGGIIDGDIRSLARNRPNAPVNAASPVINARGRAQWRRSRRLLSEIAGHLGTG